MVARSNARILLTTSAEPDHSSTEAAFARESVCECRVDQAAQEGAELQHGCHEAGIEPTIRHRVGRACDQVYGCYTKRGLPPEFWLEVDRC